MSIVFSGGGLEDLPPEIREMLGNLAGGGDDAPEKPRKSARPQPEAVADMLDDAFRHYTAPPHAFKVGDMVISKPRLDSRHPDLAGLPMKVVSLATEGWSAEGVGATNTGDGKVDIVVLGVSRRWDGDVVFLGMDSRTLEPWSPEAN